MTDILRRLLRVFVRLDGDLHCREDVEQFLEFVNGEVELMPPKVRTAIRFVLDADEALDYEEVARRLSEREGRPVTSGAVRQRVARGMRSLERALNDRRG